MRRSDSVARILFTLLFVYLFSVGATFNGVLIPEVSFFTLILMAGLLVFWLVVRWRGGWRWYTTPLDLVFVLWGVAFGLSLLANLEAWRRITIGLWYVGGYVVAWYALQDAIANRALKREVLVDAFLVAGLVIVSFGYFQLSVVDFNAPGELPRLASLVGNPNAFGSFLVVLLALLLGRLLSVQFPLGRLVLGLYFLLTAPLLILTFSRGALVGMAVAGVVFVGLLVRGSGVSSRRQFNQWWMSQRHPVRAAMTLALLVVFVLLGGAMVVVAQRTFSDPTRDLNLRGAIYGSAVSAFAEQPVTGHGLFTFGQQLSRAQSQPPDQPHSHAHNVILHIAAELGVVGLAALAVTLVVIARAAWRNWKSLDAMRHAAAITAVVGFATTHQFDMLSMMPLLALVGLVVLVIATAPADPTPMTARWRRLGHPVGVLGLAVVLVGSGLWSTSVYAQYNSAIRYGVLEEDYHGGAERLQAVIDADPQLGLYQQQQAYLYGVAAQEGDAAALALAIAAYERYLTLEPYDAIAMTNLATLYWQAGDDDAALTRLQQAVELAPRAWQVQRVLGHYAELAGETDLAIRTYKRLVSSSYHLMATDYWDETPLRRFFAESIKPSGLAALVIALESGETDPDILEYTWTRSGLPDDETTPRYVLRLLLELQAGSADADRQQTLLAQAEGRVVDDIDAAWVLVGRAAVLQANGADASAELARARERLQPDFALEDYLTGTNVAHFQFLRYAISRQFLPTVDYHITEEVPLRPFLD